MANLLEQICRASFPANNSEYSGNSANWYLVSDNLTHIKNRNFSSYHPAICIDESSIKYGFVKIWVRTSTGFGEIPNWIPHYSHLAQHKGRCPLNKDGYVKVSGAKKIPATHFQRIQLICVEKDRSWLNSFSKCLFELQTGDKQ